MIVSIAQNTPIIITSNLDRLVSQIVPLLFLLYISPRLLDCGVGMRLKSTLSKISILCSICIVLITVVGILIVRILFLHEHNTILSFEEFSYLHVMYTYASH